MLFILLIIIDGKPQLKYTETATYESQNDYSVSFVFTFKMVLVVALFALVVFSSEQTPT